MEITVTKSQLGILQHSVGNKPKGQNYRNYYCTYYGEPDLEVLVKMGLMTKGQIINNGQGAYYHVTDAGFDFLNLS